MTEPMLHTNLAGADRRARILDAAEACFVRSGFHRTTMQDVAAETGMSAGNLYRYFPSKHAIVAALSERDRRGAADSFSAMQEQPGDFMAAFAELGRRHFEEEPREKSVLALEIWAEATRDEGFRALSAGFTAEIVDRMTALLDAAEAAGSARPALDTRTLATLICTLADGLVVRRAVLPDFDAAREIPPIMSVIGALVCGTLPCRRPADLAECAP